MKKFLAVSLAFCFFMTSSFPFFGPLGNSANILRAATGQDPYAVYAGQFSPEQLDNLVVPVALYPDPLLAQVLLAATFADQVTYAAQWLRGGNDPNLIDMQPWDVSIKAVAHYPAVLFMMSDQIDWTVSLGQAYVDQSTDVMMSVQRLRAMAYSAGNLVTTPQQQVMREGGYIQIVPAQPQYIYVPVYDPLVVYHPRPHGAFVTASLITFGAGLVIGAWLNYDFNWHSHSIFYHGWNGGGWIARSRPNIHVTNIYVNNTYRNVHINRTIVNHRVNYNNLNRYSAVHRNVNYNNLGRRGPSRPTSRPANNRMSPRGTNAPGPRTNNYNRPQPQSPQVQSPQRRVTPPQTREVRPSQPSESRRVDQTRPAPQPRQIRQPEGRQAPQARQAQPQPRRIEQARPTGKIQQQPQKQQPSKNREAPKRSEDRKKK